MALTPEQRGQLKQRQYEYITKQKYFEGGLLSDIIDVAQTPQYALTGLATGKGIVQGVKERAMPSEALGLRGTIPKAIAGFAADVLLDPLTYTGIGALTKAGKAAKAGKLIETAGGIRKILGKGEKLEKGAKIIKPAATLAEQAKLGQRAGLTFMGREVPVVSKALEPVLTGLTKAGQPVKRLLGEKVTRALRLGAPAIGKGATLEDIEKFGKEFKATKQAGYKSSAIRRMAEERATNVGKITDTSLGKLIRKGVIQPEEKWKLTEYVRGTILKSSVPKIPAKLKSLGDDVVQETERQLAIRKGNKLAELEGKVFPLIPETASKEFLRESKKASIQARKFGQQDPSTKLGTHFKLQSVKPSVPLALKAGISKAMVKPSVGIPSEIIVKGNLNVAKEIIKKEEKGRRFLRIGNKFVEVKRTSAEMKGIIKKIDRAVKDGLDEPITISKNAENELKKLLNRGLYKRVGATELEINAALKNADKALRFTEDPAIMVGELIKRTGMSEAKASFVRDMSSVGVKKVGGEIKEGWAQSSLSELKGFIFPKPLIGHIDATYKAFSNIEEVQGFLKLFDTVQNFWKGLATFVNVPFHVRNWVSNLWQGYLGEVYDPRWYEKAGEIQSKVLRYNKQIGKPLSSFLTDDEFKIWANFTKEGAGGVGMYGADIEKALQQRQNPVFKAGGAVGSFIEDNSKLGMFLERTSRGYSPAEAAADVRKYFFDYTDLSDFEKNIMKRVMPFYTWSRNNIPLQIAMLIQAPAKFSAVGKAKAAIESTVKDKPLDEQYVPQWIKEGYPIYFGKNKNGLHKYFSLQGFLPIINLEDLDNPLHFLVGQMTSPFLKAPFELASNKNFYLDRPITEFKGQTKEIAGFNIPTTAAYFVEQIRPIMEYDRLKDEKLTPMERVMRFTAGAKFKTLNARKQRSAYEYLKGLEESEIKGQIEREKKAGNIKAIPTLMELLRKNQREFSL